MSSSLVPTRATTSGGLHVCPSPTRPRRRRCCQVTAAALPPASGRRAVSLAGVAAWLATAVGRADAASPLDKYVKRKKLEPLETYVPAVLLTIDQFVDLEKSLEFEKPRFDETRSLLRSGPASSLRINIRAVAQYADSTGQGKAASDAVDECLRHHVDSAKNKTVRPSWYAAEKKMVQGDGEAQRRERDGGAGR
ncbi:uncharacterized protein LOC120691536 isoform X3 [Panicum virgatum]|uniref:uncharacterized protein LOC120691536 isoform X3 n=1 Tax=Panicum virgatum TaxID=38727 RepID=UPI0019D5AF93|nr:uncharacterized protein LOC120691536 isoform X3 [Panicum virgatum]